MRFPLNQLACRALPAAILLLAACAPAVTISLAPLPDRPWTVLPGDEVRVRVYREPELSGQWVVNLRGEILAPGLGRLLVAGLNADSLTGLISSRYSTRIVDAVVDVGIVRSLPVLGDVASPGVYQAEPAMTLQQVVAKAGGMRVRSLRTPVALLQKGRDGTRYSLALDQRLDRVPLDDGDAIVVYDPGVLERWNTALDYIYRVGMVLTIVSSVLVLTRK